MSKFLGRFINLFVHPKCMNLVDIYLSKLEKQFPKRDIRLWGIKASLKKSLDNSASLSEFCRKNRINKGTVYYMLKGKRLIYLDLIDMKYIDYNKVKFSLKDSNIAVKIPVKLTPELSYLVGILRDGSINKDVDNYSCVFYSKHKESLYIVKKYLKKIFDMSRRIENNREDLYMIRIKSKTLYYFFKLVFETTESQRYWNTPRLIKLGDDEIKKFYIRGFWDAEGGCPHIENKKSLIKKNLEIKFSQKNKESLDFIKKHLNSVGIKTGNVYWNQRTYVLKITQSNIPKFKELIGSSHPIKSKRLEEVSSIFIH